MSKTKLPTIHEVDNAARANGWKISGLGPCRLYERPMFALEVWHSLSSGRVQYAELAVFGGGVDILNPADLISILHTDQEKS